MSFTGDKIKFFRKDKGLTQNSLSEISGISLSAIVKYERGEREPTFEMIQKIAFALKLPISEFLENESKEFMESFYKKFKEIKETTITLSENQIEYYSVREPIFFWKSLILALPFNEIDGINYKNLSPSQYNEIANFLDISFRIKLKEILKQQNE